MHWRLAAAVCRGEQLLISAVNFQQSLAGLGVWWQVGLEVCEPSVFACFMSRYLEIPEAAR